jgi:hypothetical protein
MSDDSLDSITPDAFAALRNLIAMLADPKRCAETLAELEKRVTEARKAEHRLNTTRERHAIELARENALLDERRGELARKARELTTREAYVAERERALERAKIVNYAGEVGGITREFVDGGQQDAE